MFERIQELDEIILHYINIEWANPVFDFLLVFMADFGLLMWPLIIAAVIVMIWGGFRSRLFLILMGLCLLIGDVGINQSIKQTVNRPRPHETVDGTRRVDWEGLDKKVAFSKAHTPRKGNSFTSGHICNNVAIAMILTLLFRRKAWPIWIWAVFMAYSRIYTGDHYFSDAVASFIVAGLYASGIYCFIAWLWQLLGPKHFPKLYERHPKLHSP
ncbi:MAG: phosphatase PAP2 family protein [Verrucomicrobiota bacterium]